MSEPAPVASGRASSARTLQVGAGLVIFGLSGFVFLALSGRDLGPAVQAPLAVAWTILNGVGIGLFMPLEQETSRRVAQFAAHHPGRPSLRSVLRYAGGSVALLAVLALLAADPIATTFLGGRRGLLVLLVLALAAQALEYLARGLLAGTGHFGRYGAQLAVDGGLRIALTAVVALLPGASVETYAAVLVLSPLVATVVTFPPVLLRQWRQSDPAGGAGQSMAALVATSLTSQLLANAGPLAIALVSTAAEQGQTGRFVAAVTIGRIPLFVFAAVQAVFLPTLAALVAGGKVAELRRATARAAAITAGLAAAGVVGIAVLGRWLMHLIYGPGFTVAALDLNLIAVSGGLFMLAQLAAQGLLAHRADVPVAVGWSVGILATAAALALPLPTTTAVAVALCAGAAVALAVHLAVLARTVRAWARGLTPTEEAP